MAEKDYPMEAMMYLRNLSDYINENYIPSVGTQLVKSADPNSPESEWNNKCIVYIFMPVRDDTPTMTEKMLKEIALALPNKIDDLKTYIKYTHSRIKPLAGTESSEGLESIVSVEQLKNVA